MSPPRQEMSLSSSGGLGVGTPPISPAQRSPYASPYSPTEAPSSEGHTSPLHESYSMIPKQSPLRQSGGNGMHMTPISRHGGFASPTVHRKTLLPSPMPWTGNNVGRQRASPAVRHSLGGGLPPRASAAKSPLRISIQQLSQASGVYGSRPASGASTPGRPMSSRIFSTTPSEYEPHLLA